MLAAQFFVVECVNAQATAIPAVDEKVAALFDLLKADPRVSSVDIFVTAVDSFTACISAAGDAEVGDIIRTPLATAGLNVTWTVAR